MILKIYRYTQPNLATDEPEVVGYTLRPPIPDAFKKADIDVRCDEAEHLEPDVEALSRMVVHIYPTLDEAKRSANLARDLAYGNDCQVTLHALGLLEVAIPGIPYPRLPRSPLLGDGEKKCEQMQGDLDPLKGPFAMMLAFRGECTEPTRIEIRDERALAERVEMACPKCKNNGTGDGDKSGFDCFESRDTRRTVLAIETENEAVSYGGRTVQDKSKVTIQFGPASIGTRRTDSDTRLICRSCNHVFPVPQWWEEANYMYED